MKYKSKLVRHPGGMPDLPYLLNRKDAKFDVPLGKASRKGVQAKSVDYSDEAIPLIRKIQIKNGGDK